MAEVAYFDVGQQAVAAEPVAAPETEALARLERFTTILETVLADHGVAERVARAGVQVRIVLTDLPSQPVTLLLQAPAATVRRGYVESAPDVQLRLRSADLDDVLMQRAFLPLHILSGEVEFVGCIRKLLRVFPILSTAAVEACGAPGI